MLNELRPLGYVALAESLNLTQQRNVVPFPYTLASFGQPLWLATGSTSRGRFITARTGDRFTITRDSTGKPSGRYSPSGRRLNETMRRSPVSWLPLELSSQVWLAERVGAKR